MLQATCSSEPDLVYYTCHDRMEDAAHEAAFYWAAMGKMRDSDAHVWLVEVRSVDEEGLAGPLVGSVVTAGPTLQAHMIDAAEMPLTLETDMSLSRLRAKLKRRSDSAAQAYNLCVSSIHVSQDKSDHHPKKAGVRRVVKNDPRSAEVMVYGDGSVATYSVEYTERNLEFPYEDLLEE